MSTHEDARTKHTCSICGCDLVTERGQVIGADGVRTCLWCAAPRDDTRHAGCRVNERRMQEEIERLRQQLDDALAASCYTTGRDENAIERELEKLRCRVELDGGSISVIRATDAHRLLLDAHGAVNGLREEIRRLQSVAHPTPSPDTEKMP